MLNDRFMTALQAISGHRHLETLADLLVKAAALLAFLFLLSAYLTLPTLPIFGHDEVHYYPNVDFKLIEDGRWLNYLLHNFLRAVPLPLWSILYLGLSWLLFYRLARTYAFDAAYAALVASTIVVSYPFLEMSLWPATVVPSLMLVLLAMRLQACGVAYQIIYVVSGILMFGGMQSLYFVLPLLFVPQFLASNQTTGARWRLLFSHMCWWVAGSVAGVLAMSVMLWFLSGTFFPEPAPWRNTNPVVDLASLLANINYVITRFVIILDVLRQLGEISGRFMFVVAVMALLRWRDVPGNLQALLLLFAVFISFFVFTVPHAAIIVPRSLLAMAAVIVLSLAMLPGRTALGRMVGTLLVLKLCLSFSAECQEYLKKHEAETTVFLNKLQELFTGYPMAYTTVALDGTMDRSQPEAVRFNDTSLMQPLLTSLGIQNYLDCRIPSRCASLGAGGEPIAVRPFANGRLELSVDAANIAIIRYRH